MIGFRGVMGFMGIMYMAVHLLFEVLKYFRTVYFS